ncbi:MAG: type VI secretion system baseplate subunit TssG [Paracoccaceae bacterium]
MANVAGHPRPDLSHTGAEPETMGFFELLRRLETEGQRFGRAGGPGLEPARLGQRVRLSIATRDIAGFAPGVDGGPARVDVEVLGLLGPEGAMPLHMTRWIMARLSERWFSGAQDRETSDTTFLDFCNMLQHRMIALYWRGWADARPDVQTELGTGGRVQAMLQALAGVGMPGMREGNQRSIDPELPLRFATSLASSVQGVERLTGYLTDLLDAPVSLAEFVGHWMEIPRGLQTRLGHSYAGLGTGAVVGARTFQRQTRAELRVGPLGLAQYRRLLDDRALQRELRRAILFVAGQDIEFDLRLVLAREAIPAPRLGQCQLGRTTWVSRPDLTDADDLCLAGFSIREGAMAA